MAELTDLRSKLKLQGANLKVIKNRLAKIALDGKGGDAAGAMFVGPVAVAFSPDPVAASKVVAEFAKGNEKLVLIGALMGPDGRRDAQQAYAPHGYDIVVDTPQLARASNARVEFIFTRHRETAERLDMPMLVGEWGAFGGHGADVVPAAWGVVDVFETLGCSDTYW